MTTSESVLEKQRDMWSQSATGWGRWVEWNGRALAPVTEWICRAAGLAPGQRVLDVASGTGQPALTAAARVLPGGSLVASDLSPEMLATAERRARSAGHAHVECRVMDAEHLDFPDRSFDAVMCAFGLMFCPDSAKAIAEIRRVLKPGGRFALVVWDEASKNPFFSTIGRAVAPILKAPPPDPKAPGQFRLAPESEFRAALDAGGLRGATIETLATTFVCDSPTQYWEIVYDHATALRLALEALPVAEQTLARETALAAAAALVVDGRLPLGTTSLVASGTR